jgi:hypothetical protein
MKMFGLMCLLVVGGELGFPVDKTEPNNIQGKLGEPLTRLSSGQIDLNFSGSACCTMSPWESVRTMRERQSGQIIMTIMHKVSDTIYQNYTKFVLAKGFGI